MITQDIYDYLVDLVTGTDVEFSKLNGVILQHGIFVQLLQDGMILFHDIIAKKLVRVLLMHGDSINDLVIKEYQAGEEDQLSYFTCSKDNTLRLWTTNLKNEHEICKDPVENDLKRIVYLDYHD